MEEIKISVLLDNNLIQANGLSRFTFIPSGRPYIMYTLNEKSVQNGEPLNKVYVSEEGDKTTQFQPINQDEWVNLKNIMGQLGEANAQMPNNIQLSQLNAAQYVVGPYKKIAINDNVMSNILTNQLANQPKEEQIPQPTGNTQFFDPSLNVSAMEETPAAQLTEVPNAFGMTAPVPEEAAPISLVQEEAAPVAQPQVIEQPVATTIVQEVQPAATTLVQPVEMPQPIEMPVQAVEMPQPVTDVSAQPVEMPTLVTDMPVQSTEMTTPVAEVPTQAVEMVAPVVPQVVETVVQTQQPADDITIVKQALQTVLNYCNGDMNILNQLLNEQGLTVIVQNMNETQVQAPVAEAQEEFPEPVTSVSDMSIDNLPVVEQEAPAEENVLAEESFEPSAPTLPVDNMEAQNVVNSLPDGVIPGMTETPTPVAETPVAPVAEAPVAPVVVAPQDNVVQFPEQYVAETNTTPVQEAPVATTDNVVPFVADVAPQAEVQPVVPQASLPVEQPTTSYEVPTTLEPVQLVQTQIIESAPTTTIPSAVEAMQNSEVSIAVPQDIAPADQGMPTITPITQEDIMPVSVPQAPVAEVPAEPSIDPSAFLDAGPVIMPVGQESVTSQGLPGDSGVKVLEKVA